MHPSLVWMPEGGPIWFPPLLQASPEGLLMVGGDLSPRRIIYAYTHGIFPWYEQDSPILWWSPDPRCVLFPDKLHISSSLRRVLNSERFVCTEDVCFERVIHACATAGGRDLNGTWLIPEMQKAYTELHRRGHAHSVEVWHNARLVGGLYGLLIGRVFFGESMFHEETDASKVAVIHLVHWLKQHHGALIDCQQTTPHMLRLGAEELPRRQFVSLLKEFCPQYRFPPVQYDNGE